MKKKLLKQLVCLSGMLFITFPAWSAGPPSLLPSDCSGNQASRTANIENPLFAGGMILARGEGGGNGGGNNSGIKAHVQNQERHHYQEEIQTQFQLQDQAQVQSRTRIQNQLHTATQSQIETQAHNANHDGGGPAQ